MNPSSTAPSSASDTDDDAGTESDPTADRLRAVGLTWHENGQVSLRGPLLDLQRACDRAFLALADHFGAEEEGHPALLPAASLDRIDYLDAFPHLANFAVSLADDEANLDTFRAGPPLGAGGEVRLTAAAPVRDLLTPAACYHLYVEHEGDDVGLARYLTTRNTCFRREAYYRPLRRQRAFEMRELVCIGARDVVVSFLEHGRALVTALFLELDLPVDWEVATDPFFRPSQNSQRLFQQVHATKSEAVYPGSDGALAIASVNLHETHFGDAFAISSDGEPATSGCVAFGLDRWLYALTDRYPLADVPDVEAAARRVLDRVETGR